MIDDISESGSWADAIASHPRRCEWCAHYVVKSYGPLCMLDRALIPCEFYQREPGADDDA